tara:strand:+ start:365 stop:556 length:192 start_codon:yes stop_codon:yes gene_type:complete
MNQIMEAHQELLGDLELIIDTLCHPAYETFSEEVKESITKERNRLEMLLEVLEEDEEYKKVSL